MAKSEGQPITYASAGVDYGAIDPVKKQAQLAARETSRNIERFGFKVVELSRGESAFVIDEGDRYSAHVIEGLGTKNLVADRFKKQQKIAKKIEKFNGKSYYHGIAQDTVAMIVNDLITVGADPVVVNAYWAAGKDKWFKNTKRAEDLIKGWEEACYESRATWGGGESPTLRDIIKSSASDLAGSAYGIIRPRERLTLGDKLSPGDKIILVGSSGIHANGLSLAHEIASTLPKGYMTPLSDGKSYGESLLTPTHIYARMIKRLFDEGIDIHYMVNMTGHGWRKLMRANRDLSYVIEKVPQAQPIFKFIQEHSGNSDEEMYGNFNMGAGFAVFVPEKDVQEAIGVMRIFEFQGMDAGVVEKGPRKVIIKPKNIVFEGSTLDLR